MVYSVIFDQSFGIFIFTGSLRSETKSLLCSLKWELKFLSEFYSSAADVYVWYALQRG